MEPTVGRVVHYRLSEDDHSRIIAERMRDTGNQGNVVHAGEIVPVIIVRVWPGGLINGQAILDGNHSLWITSAAEGDGYGQWSWPPRV